MIEGQSSAKKTYWLGCKSSDGGFKEILGLDALDEADVGTSVSSQLQPRNSLIHSEHLRRICSANDDLSRSISTNIQLRHVRETTYKIGTSRNRITSKDGGSDARQELLPGNNLLAHQVTTALSLDLVFNVKTGEAGSNILFHSSGNVGRPTEAGESLRL